MTPPPLCLRHLYIPLICTLFFVFFSSCFLFHFTTSHLPPLHQFISGQSTLCTGRFYCAAPAARLIYILYLQRRHRRGAEGLFHKACSVIVTQPLYRPRYGSAAVRTWCFAGFGVRVPFGLPLKTAGLH